MDHVYPGEDPIGRRMYEGGCKSAECEIVTVIGVVEDVRYLGLDDTQREAAVGTVYVPHTQWFVDRLRERGGAAHRARVRQGA